MNFMLVIFILSCILLGSSVISIYINIALSRESHSTNLTYTLHQPTSHIPCINHQSSLTYNTFPHHFPCRIATSADQEAEGLDGEDA